MCRLFAITSNDPLNPMVALEALDVMREGHDASGVGIVLRDLGGEFEAIKECPILSGIFTEAGLKRLDEFMMHQGFLTKYRKSIRPKPKKVLDGVPSRYAYLIRAYDYPDSWHDFSNELKHDKLTEIRLILRQMGEAIDDMIVFSFWPDLITIKEIGDPLTIGKYLGFEKDIIKARLIMAQGRQNTNYAINLYACHPFFLNGYSTMTNGENTAFIPIKEYLQSRNITGYTGYQSDSEVFTHILHYAIKKLGLNLDVYKHIITPLSEADLKNHPNYNFLSNLKMSCRKLIIDGPNCVIGSLPDNTMFMVQDRKKLRPGVVGGKNGVFAFSSEICGLDAVIPDRDKSCDFQPMYLDTVYVSPKRDKLHIIKQTDKLQTRL